MSGKKQHHIPQSLQRGFLFDAKAEKTYVHRRNGVSHPASIADVAAQRFFYSRLSSDGSKTLDDKITEYENRLGGLLIQLRAIPVNNPVNAALAAEVIAHLTPRSANIRRMFGSSMGQFMSAAAEAFSDGDTVGRILGLAEPEPNPVWNKHLKHMFEKEPQLKKVLDLLRVPEELLDRLIFMIAKEHFVSTYDAKNLGVIEAFTSILGGLDSMVRNAHNKALAEGLVAQSHKESLEALVWHIRAAPPEGAVLPDCVAIGVDEGGATFLPYMMTNRASVSAVAMPLTSQRLLVGVRPGHAAPDLANFNRDASTCSDELFITASNAPVFAEIGANLGKRWSGEIDAFIQGVLKDLVPNKAVENISCGDKQPLPPISYQLSFNGLGATEEDVAPLNESTQRLISRLHPLFDLARLDGVTFAAGFQDALDSVERGFDVNASPEGLPDFVAQGAASLLVLREGAVKVRVVLNAAYGFSLVGEEPQDAEVAVHLLVAALANVDTINRIENALPGFLMEPVMMSDHDGVLHCAVRKALRAYRYARDSAGFGADELVEQEFTKYLIGTFDNAYQVLATAKEDHAASPDFPKLFEVAHSMASDMLISAARLIGHRHGMERFDFSPADADVGKAMASRQLTGWIEVFSKDLECFWQKSSWTRADFCSLNIHAERLLWANRIVLWREPNGQGTMIMAAPQQLPSTA